MEYLKDKIKMILATDHKKNISDLMAFDKLSGLMKNYVAWNSSSIRPSALTIILNDILINKRKNIVEFGSGISTLYIAKILKKEGGSFVSVEHDRNWLMIVQEMLNKESLDGLVKFIHAPLEKSKYSLNNLNWYSEKKMYSCFNKDILFDLILIDGPLSYTKKLELSRYPAIPFLKSNNFISKNSSIYLDDIHRVGEQKIVDIWKDKFNFRFIKSYNVGGLGISFNGDSYNVL